MCLAKLVATLVLSLISFQCTHSFHRDGFDAIDPHEILNVSGREYHVFAGANLLQVAFQECVDAGLNLVAFEEDGEYIEVLEALRDNGFENHWFWTAAIKDAGFDDWMWATTGDNITKTFWIPGNPQDVAIDEIGCMSFNIKAGGWDSDPIPNNYALGHICESIFK